MSSDLVQHQGAHYGEVLFRQSSEFRQIWHTLFNLHPSEFLMSISVNLIYNYKHYN